MARAEASQHLREKGPHRILGPSTAPTLRRIAQESAAGSGLRGEEEEPLPDKGVQQQRVRAAPQEVLHASEDGGRVWVGKGGMGATRQRHSRQGAAGRVDHNGMRAGRGCRGRWGMRMGGGADLAGWLAGWPGGKEGKRDEAGCMRKRTDKQFHATRRRFSGGPDTKADNARPLPKVCNK